MIELKVEGMSCQGCVRSVRAILSKTLGVEKDAVDVDLEAERARVPDADADALARALTKLDAQGFPAARL